MSISLVFSRTPAKMCLFLVYFWSHCSTEWT